MEVRSMKKTVLGALVVLLAASLVVACGGSGGTKAAGTGARVKAGKITFSYKPLPGEEYGVMNLVGDFNGWNPSDPNYAMEKKADGGWAITVEFAPGRYIYKYTADGQWIFQDQSEVVDQMEPKPTGFMDDGFGGKNAYIDVE